jgi:hypothetical protein
MVAWLSALRADRDLLSRDIFWAIVRLEGLGKLKKIQ